MATLKFPNEAPPRDWIYWQPETRLRIKGDNLKDLVARVVGHRRHKGLTPDDFEAVDLDVQRQLCARLGPSLCQPEGPGDPWVPVDETKINLGLGEVMGFSRAALEWIAGGRQIVPLAENERRRAICVECPLNNAMAGCQCAALYRAIEKAVPAERRFDDLHVCGICHCTLKALCAAPASVVRASEEGRNLHHPVNCWIPGLPDN